MSREFCSYCGTVTNEGERMCQTRAESDKCPWMVGVHREVIVKPYPPATTPKQN